MSFNFRERDTSYCFILLNKIPVSTIKNPEWRFQAFNKISLFGSLLKSRLALKIKHLYEELARAYRLSLEIKTPQASENGILLLRNEKFVIFHHCRRWKCKVDHPFQSTVVNQGDKVLDLKFSRIHLAKIIFEFWVERIYLKRNHSQGLLRRSSLQTKVDQRRNEFRLENSETSSTSSIWPRDHREGLGLFMPFYSLVQLIPKALYMYSYKQGG